MNLYFSYNSTIHPYITKITIILTEKVLKKTISSQQKVFKKHHKQKNQNNNLIRISLLLIKFLSNNKMYKCRVKVKKLHLSLQVE
jgi:hypothetical protein